MNSEERCASLPTRQPGLPRAVIAHEGFSFLTGSADSHDALNLRMGFQFSLDLRPVLLPTVLPPAHIALQDTQIGGLCIRGLLQTELQFAQFVLHALDPGVIPSIREELELDDGQQGRGRELVSFPEAPIRQRLSLAVLGVGRIENDQVVVASTCWCRQTLGRILITQAEESGILQLEPSHRSFALSLQQYLAANDARDQRRFLDPVLNGAVGFLQVVVTHDA